MKFGIPEMFGMIITQHVYSIMIYIIQLNYL